MSFQGGSILSAIAGKFSQYLDHPVLRSPRYTPTDEARDMNPRRRRRGGTRRLYIEPPSISMPRRIRNREFLSPDMAGSFDLESAAWFNTCSRTVSLTGD